MTNERFRPTHYLTDVFNPERVRAVRVTKKVGPSITWVDENNIEGHTPAKDIRKLDMAVYPKKKTVYRAAILLARAFRCDFTAMAMPEPPDLGNGFVLVEWTGGPGVDDVREVLRQEFHALEFQVRRA